MNQKDKASKLEKQYDAVNSKEKNLEEEESEIVQNYLMKQGDYKILITIYEANDLEPRPANFLLFEADKSACDAFVQIEVRGQIKRTHIRKQTNNPIWQQSFYFYFENMSIQELDRSKISFNVYDKNHFIIANSHLGQFQLDWTNVYFRRFHEIYRGWLTLSDPKEEIEGPVGYLLCNISVLGPDDKIMVHDSAFIKDPLTTIEDTITNPKTPLIDYTITVEVYRAESLVPLDLAYRSVDAYVVAKFSGNKVNSSVIRSLNPEWNEALKIGTGVPNKTKYLTLQVWNYNRLSGDDLIGVLKIPFIDICNCQNPAPQWGHLYGPPMCAKDEAPANYATKMQIYGEDLGSHYRGRLLYKVIGKKYVHSKNCKNEIKFKFPFKPTPVVPLKTYTLSVELIQGFQLPIRQQAIVHVGIGQYMIKSQSHITKNKLCQFMEIMEDKKVQFPQDVAQVPDIIIYFCNGKQEKNRLSFVRIKAATVTTNERFKHSKIYEMQSDKSLHLLEGSQLGGYIACRVHLYTDAVPSHKTIENDYKQKYNYKLMFYLYKGQNFPPANIEGDCDPFIRFNCYGQSKDSKQVEGSFNPFWKERIQMDIQIQDVFRTNITKGIVCEAYDFQQSQDHQFIGSFLIQLNSKNMQVFKKGQKTIEFIYYKPKWYYLINPHIQVGKNVFGRVLIGVALFRQEDITKNYVPTQMYKINNLIPTEERLIQVYLIGLRDIKDQSKSILSNGQAQVIMKIGDKEIHVGQLKLKQSGCQINKLCQALVQIPKNKSLFPFIDFKVKYNNKFYGFNSINLYEILPKLKQKEENAHESKEDSEQTILDIQGLEKQLQMIKQKKKKDKLMNEVEDPFKEKNIEQLPTPFQLGLPRDMIEQNKIELDNLLKAFSSNYQKDPAYQYVVILQKNRDRDQKALKQQQASKQINIKSEENRKIQVDRCDDEKANLFTGQNHLTTEIAKPQTAQKNFTVFDRIIKTKSLNASSGNKLLSRTGIKTNMKTEMMSIAEVRSKDEGEKQFLTKREMETLLKQEQQRDIGLKNNFRETKQIKKDTEDLNLMEEDKKNQVLANNGVQGIKSHYRQAKTRFSITSPGSNQKLVAEQNIDFEIHTDQQFSDIPIKEKAIVYADVQRVMQQENKDQKEAIERENQYRFGQAVKLTLFGWNRKKKMRDIQTYQDYDTEDGQDLNIIPEWYKGRKILTSDFQDLNFKGKKIQTIALYGGKKIQNSPLQSKGRESAGHIKLIMLSELPEIAKQKEEYYNKLLKPKDYYCRIYILKGKSLISNYDAKPSTYLKFTLGDQTTSYKQQTYKKEENNPEYYICHQIPLKLPGPSLVKIEVIETHHIFGKFIDKLLGYTQIDLQQRYFMKRWHLYQKKPIQLRNLYSEYGMGTQGRLETWVDLVEKKKWLSTPAHKIHPPPFDKYQLRVIVWSTDDCVYKNVEMQSNDVFVRACIGTSEHQETDTHWCCRSVGNFNYRFKFPVNYPPKPEDMYSDVFTVQIWDRDLVGYNNLIGQKRININQVHRIIQKAVKRKKPVKASMRIKQKNFKITDRFWYDVYNHKQKDEFGIPQPQGRVQMSFELVPFQKAEKQLANGYGRSDPNVYPTLPEPPGRLQFDFFSPLAFIKQIIGPKLYSRWCCRFICCIVIVLVGLFAFIFLPTLLAVKI